eukprot:TRINITY_DN182410_c0_g1_i1.p1 TRINITY_DN182410_c0_g1~~TRINITY_DN182410_c0_g1_i1.p1  ORF type:complete len:193 (+),score=2.11 TRINITY_DN182410_c0_g1_i1:85-663(+)
MGRVFTRNGDFSLLFCVVIASPTLYSGFTVNPLNNLRYFNYCLRSSNSTTSRDIPTITGQESVISTPLGYRTSDVSKEIYVGAYRPRLTVRKSANHVYAVLVDDLKAHTLAAASTLSPEIRNQLGTSLRRGKGGIPLVKGDTVGAAFQVGVLLGKRARGKGITKVKFDRGSYRYHGKVRAIAEGARAAGLDF